MKAEPVFIKNENRFTKSLPQLNSFEHDTNQNFIKTAPNFSKLYIGFVGRCQRAQGGLPKGLNAGLRRGLSKRLAKGP